MLSRVLHKPLAHFLLIGLALSFAYSVLNFTAGQSGSYRILLTTDDVRRLQITFAAQWQRAPSPKEKMRGSSNRKSARKFCTVRHYSSAWTKTTL